MKHFAIALACFFVATAVRADGPSPAPFGSPATTYGVAQEFNRMVALLGDDVLRELVCRLSYQRYTPGTLSHALNLSTDEVMRRVDVLRGWGMVRPFTSDSVNTIIESSPGEGERTLGRPDIAPKAMPAAYKYPASKCERTAIPKNWPPGLVAR